MYTNDAYYVHFYLLTETEGDTHMQMPQSQSQAQYAAVRLAVKPGRCPMPICITIINTIIHHILHIHTNDAYTV
jgi:hypothetical protein